MKLEELEPASDDDVYGTFRVTGHHVTSLVWPEGRITRVEIIDTGIEHLDEPPERVYGPIVIRANPKLKDIRGLPKIVSLTSNAGIYIQDNRALTSLEGCPEIVEGHFTCYGSSSLTSLQHAPKHVGGDVNFQACNSLTSLAGIGYDYFRTIDGETIYTGRIPLKNVLGFALIKLNELADGLVIPHEFTSRYPKFVEIIRKYSFRGREVLLDFQHELIDAGFSDAANL